MNKKPDLLAEHRLTRDKAETECRLKDALRRLHKSDTELAAMQQLRSCITSQL